MIPNMVSKPCLKLSRANRLVNSQISNKRLQKKRSQASSKAVKNDKDSKGVEPRLRREKHFVRGEVLDDERSQASSKTVKND